MTTMSRFLERCVSFRAMLYLATGVAAVIVITSGDFASIPDELQDEARGAFWVWGGLSLACGPIALLANILIHKSPPCIYRAMWIRMGADIGLSVSVAVYTVLRLYMGDYHIYSTAILFAAWVYTCALVIWDAGQLIGVEKLANELHLKEAHGE